MLFSRITMNIIVGKTLHRFEVVQEGYARIVCTGLVHSGITVILTFQSRANSQMCTLDCSLYALLTVHPNIIFVKNQLDAQMFHVCLFLFSTCFGQPCAHHQEN